jgi:FHS family glucose/mannose:H+ symporter-like MFS transporter
MHTGMLSLRSHKSAIKGTAFVHVDFVLTGVVMTLLGPLLPVFAARWRLDDAQAGYLFIAQFVSSMFGMLLSSALIPRIGYRRTLIVGLVLMAAGIAALARADWFLGLVAVSVFGVGFGTNTPAANLFSAEANPEKRASALNLLNSSWGVGAMGCPLLVAAAQHSGHIPFFLYALAVGLFAIAVGMESVRFLVDAPHAVAERAANGKGSVWSNRMVPLVAAVFFIYVGTETCVGGWVASYARRMDLSSHAFWAMTPSFFWGALLFGRVTAPLLLRLWRETTVASMGLTLASLGVGVLLAAHSMTLIVVGALMSGLGLASIFPISVAMLSRWFGRAASRLGGPVFSLGNLGGAVLPWLVGALSTHFGSLRVGFIVPLLGALTLLAVYLANGRPRRRVPETA